MATCKECNRTAMAGLDVCFYHNPDTPEDAKKRARAKGGKASKPVQPWAIPDELTTVESTTDLKRLLNSCLVWLVKGNVTPSQARALVTIANSLKDVLELELVRDLRDIARDMGIEAEGSPWDELALGDLLNE